MSGYRGQESHFEHYLWQELESPSFLSLQDVVEYGQGALFWARSGDLEEVVVHTQDGIFTGIKYEKILKPRFEGEKATPAIICSARLAIDGYNNGGYAPGTVKPYVYLGSVPTEMLENPTALFPHLVSANIQTYADKLDWLEGMSRRTASGNDPGFEAFYEDTQRRYQRLTAISSGSVPADF